MAAESIARRVALRVVRAATVREVPAVTAPEVRVETGLREVRRAAHVARGRRGKAER